MNPFAALFERKSDPAGGGPLHALGEYLQHGGSSARAMMRIATVNACVRVIAETVASLPLFVLERRPDGSRRRATEHHLHAILHDEPTPRHTSFAWRETLQAHLLLRGNAYAKILRDERGRPLELWPLHPDRTEVLERDDLSLAYRYRMRETSEPRTVAASEIVHVPGLCFDGVTGLSPVQEARYAIEVADATAETAARLYRRGMRHSVAVTHPKTLGEDGLKNLRESYAEATGPTGSERPFVLEEGVTVATLSMTPDDAEFLDTRKYTRTEIAALFRVPAHLIGDLERATHSNIEQQALEFVTQCIRPWLVRWEQALTRSLLAPEERGRYFLEFSVEGLLRGDSAARAAFYKELHAVGAITANQVCDLENLPRAGAEGDSRYVPANLMLLGTPHAPGAGAAERRSEVQA